MVPVSSAGFTAFLLYSTLNTLSFVSNTHTHTHTWLDLSTVSPLYVGPSLSSPSTCSFSQNPLLIFPVGLAPADSASKYRSSPKIIEGRFEQAVTDRPRANANSDLLSVRHDVRSGTRSSAVHTSSLHGCLIRSVWAPHSHGNQSVKRDG